MLDNINKKFKNLEVNAVNIIIVLSVLMYVVQINIQYGSFYLGLNRFFFLDNFWWQPLTTIFAHGGFFHLGMNMFVLYQFGTFIEKDTSSINFLFLYFLCGILTSLLSLYYIYYLDSNVNIVGASGAISAVLGYVAFINKYQRAGIITWVLLISVVPVLIGLPIAWYSHFIGLALGFLYGILFRNFK